MGQTREQRVIKQLSNPPSVQKFTAVATDMYLPNHSGVTNHPEFKSLNKAWDLVISNPHEVYGMDTQVFIGWALRAMVITKIVINLDSNANDVAGDLKYADTFIGLANPVVINDFDTAAGVRTDTSISSGTVAEGKAIYLQFDSEPAEAINQMHVHIEWRYS